MGAMSPRSIRMEASKKTLLERLSAVQTALKAPKGQRNTFGNYNYRNCEDILEAVKPLLAENSLTLTISDELVNIGERYYIKATASVFTSAGGELGSYGYAREEETKKGMDGSQITGAASSYARKYALNGLFLIDDTKDSDATNDHGKARVAPKGAIQAVTGGKAGGPEKPVQPLGASVSTPAKDLVDPETGEIEPSLTDEHMATLMQLAKHKGYATKEAAVAFLDAQAMGPFTKLPDSQFEAFKKTVIGSGWKKPDAEVI